MGFLEAILSKIGLQLVDYLWVKIEAKLEQYFETRSKLNSISTEASALNAELKTATTDAERIQILRKIGSFSERLGT